jgi:phosphate transport system substrate-binding protein
MFKGTTTKRWLVAGIAAALLSLGAAACGGDDDDTNDEPTAGPGTAQPTATAKSGIDYGKLSGEVRIDGSSTVFPISQAVAEEFGKVAKGVRVNVGLSGTGGGFEKFCRGEIQVADASRPINQKEKDACAANQITDTVELQVGIDALTVVLNPANTWATCVTTKELNLMYRLGGAAKWSDVRPEWPAENIKFYYPGPDSGTFTYFVEEAITKVDKESKHRSDGTASEDDNILAKGVEGDKNALGYFGFAYYQEAGKKLKALQIDNGKGCVAPTFETALNGTYAPLSRPLFIYTRESFLKEKPEVLGLVKFYLDNTAELVKEVGYINLPGDLLAKNQAKVAPFLPK